MKKRQKDTAKKVGAGFIAGAIAGAIAGILLAPKKGKELRADIKKTANKIAKDVAKKVSKAEKLTKKKYEALVDEVGDLYKKAKKVKPKDLEEISDYLKAKWPEIEIKIKKKEAKGKK